MYRKIICKNMDKILHCITLDFSEMGPGGLMRDVIHIKLRELTLGPQFNAKLGKDIHRKN